jgi:hypothetical protein
MRQRLVWCGLTLAVVAFAVTAVAVSIAFGSGTVDRGLWAIAVGAAPLGVMIGLHAGIVFGSRKAGDPPSAEAVPRRPVFAIRIVPPAGLTVGAAAAAYRRNIGQSALGVIFGAVIGLVYGMGRAPGWALLVWAAVVVLVLAVTVMARSALAGMARQAVWTGVPTTPEERREIDDPWTSSLPRVSAAQSVVGQYA